jgi:hypothetical protein
MSKIQRQKQIIDLPLQSQFYPVIYLFIFRRFSIFSMIFYILNADDYPHNQNNI